MNTNSGLRRELGVVQYLTVGVGAIVGIAWLIVLGVWLTSSGPLGAALAFVLGGVFMILVAACYCELAISFPYAGGEVVYMRALFGPRVSFAVGWFLVLAATATTAFEAVSFAWLTALIFPALRGSPVYTALGTPITSSGLLLGLSAAAVVTTVNYRGIRASARLQDGLTLVKLCAVGLFIVAGLLWGDARNLQPLFHGTGPRPPWIGTLWIAATAPFWLGGFQIIPQGIEERSVATTAKSVGLAAMLSVLIGVAFYCLVIIASAMAGPREFIVSGELPAVRAMQTTFRSPVFTKIVLLGMTTGILATWNACTLWASRLLLALARDGSVPAALGSIHPRFGTPGNAVLVASLVCVVGIFLGRSILLPVVNMGAISLALVYVACCLGTLRRRRVSPHSFGDFRVPGGRSTIFIAIAAASLMAAVVALEPLTRSNGAIPTEWILFGAWAILGVVCWRLAPITASTRGKSM